MFTPKRKSMHFCNKLLLIMKLTAVLILAACLHVSGRGFSQIVTYSAKNASVQTVFAAIEKQTGYSFFYNNEDLKGNHPISGNVKNQPLDKALDIFLKDQPFTFNILGKTIFIKAKPGVRSLDASLSATDTLPTPLLVHGRVTDSVGNALSGAVVKVKGTKRGAYTDVNGYFKNMAYMGDVLMISFVSYQTKEIVINSAKIGTISLSLSLSKLDDVSIISTGYQKIKKDQLTGAASSMNEEQYHQREAVTGNFLESLEGKIPGLVYNGQTGELTIRGVSSFDAVKQPLIVLDGFPTEIDLRTINPNDIVSISVLRDAAAASIYGVRASNGVIIVETRRGRSGKTVFNLRTTAAVQRKPDFSYLNYAPASEFVQLERDYFNKAAPAYFLYQFGLFKMNPAEEILFGGTQLTVSNPLLTPDQINAKLAALGSYDNLKEYEQLFYKTRQATNINFYVSGVGERNTYMLGLNNIQEMPVTLRSDSKQFNLSIANTFRISDRFNLDFKSTYTNSVDRNGNVPSYADFYPY